MSFHRVALMTILLTAATALAGCVSEDPAPAPPAEETVDPAEEAAPTADTGSITGQVVTNDLDEVQGAALALLDSEGAIVSDKKSDLEGRFTFNAIAPGTYQLQVSAICCKANARQVEVVAGEVTDVGFQLAKLTARDLKEPYVEADEWNGFMACGIGTIVVTWATCSTFSDTPAEDPNQDFLHRWNVTDGLKTIYVALVWEPVGGFSGTDMWANVEDDGCGVTCPDSRTYAYANQGPNIIFRIDEGPSEDLSFSNLTEERTIQMRVFPGGDVNVMYQQPFTVYWYEFYWEPAPEDFNPIPDQ